jgi:maltose O-acetyltransferase
VSVSKLYAMLASAFTNLYIRQLRRKGLKVGKNLFVVSNVSLDRNNCHLISIGDNCTLAHNVVILAHDTSGCVASRTQHRIAPVKLGNNCFIGSNTVVLPGVTIGDNVIVGAGSVVTRNLPSNCVAAGNPARVLETMDEFGVKQRRRELEKSNIRLAGLEN